MIAQAIRKRMLDGLEISRAEFDLGEVARLIERTAIWVSPETFELLPVWFPEHARRALYTRIIGEISGKAAAIVQLNKF